MVACTVIVVVEDTSDTSCDVVPSSVSVVELGEFEMEEAASGVVAETDEVSEGEGGDRSVLVGAFPSLRVVEVELCNSVVGEVNVGDADDVALSVLSSVVGKYEGDRPVSVPLVLLLESGEENESWIMISLLEPSYCVLNELA